MVQAPTKHIGIIMDGNGRWAEARGLDRLKGHVKGVDRVREVIRISPLLQVTHLTLFAFSTENWKRKEAEVNGLMTLFGRYIRAEAAKLVQENVRVRFIGERSRLSKKLQSLMSGLEEQTQENTRLQLTIALNYGGRDEITRATRRIADALQKGELSSCDICEAMIDQHLDTKGLPDPDMIIRTSGEFRTSNFLAWQSAYAEYAFTDTAWPDFTTEEYGRIVKSLEHRERRFGETAAL